MLFILFPIIFGGTGFQSRVCKFYGEFFVIFLYDIIIKRLLGIKIKSYKDKVV